MSAAASPSAPAGFRGAFRTDRAARHVYAQAAGIAHIEPLAVAVPVDVDDVERLLEWARRRGIPLTPRGSGSSMGGGAIGTGVVVDLSRWRAVSDVSLEERSMLVAPGALRDTVDRAARQHGLRFPVHPSSGSFCTIGGMTATNAAGAHSMRFGATRAWVRGIDCLLSDGRRLSARRGAPIPPGFDDLTGSLRGLAPHIAPRQVRKESSGYALRHLADGGDCVDLLVGSEGTLAIFTAIELGLAPLPAATRTLLAAFLSLEHAADAAVQARDAGATACELLERTFLDFANRDDLPSGTEAVLVADVEGNDAAEARATAEAVARSFARLGALEVRAADTDAGGTELWEIRHAASPSLARLDPHLKSMQFIEDAAVPPAHLVRYIRGVRAALDRQGMRGVIFGHAGDAHVHVNPLVDLRRDDWRERVGALLDEVTELVAAVGGTLAGEHGDGRLRAPLLSRTWPPEAVQAFAEVKRSFDAAGILNPGVKLPLAGQRPIETVKYDPALPSLDPRAARALDTVAQRRAYDAFRLDLI